MQRRISSVRRGDERWGLSRVQHRFLAITVRMGGKLYIYWCHIALVRSKSFHQEQHHRWPNRPYFPYCPIAARFGITMRQSQSLLYRLGVHRTSTPVS